MDRKKLTIILALFLIPPIGVLLYTSYRYYSEAKSGEGGGDAAADSYEDLKWGVMRQLDVKSGDRSEELAKFDGQRVRIPGFVVPLDDNDTSLAEFLLVPSPQACIHVPPPPPNQMVLVKMQSDKAPQRSWGPVWVKGRFRIATTESQYGNTSFKLYGEEAEPYRRLPNQD